MLHNNPRINKPITYGVTHLMCAVNDNDVNLAKILIESSAELDLQDDGGNTALIIAATMCNAGFVKLLIDAGANLNLKNQFGSTALIAAVKSDAAKELIENTVEILVSAGANLDCQDRAGFSALMLAASYANDRLVEILINAGANVNLCDNSGRTALIETMYVNMFYRSTDNIVIMLMNAGANIELQDKWRNTALTFRIKYNTFSAENTVKLLGGEQTMHWKTTCADTALMIGIKNYNNRGKNLIKILSETMLPAFEHPGLSPII